MTLQKQQLTESKILRKKAEEDAQLLANRIALLQLEEQKAMRKVEETKKKADEIMKQKNRNLEAQKQKADVIKLYISDLNIHSSKKKEKQKKEDFSTKTKSLKKKSK